VGLAEREKVRRPRRLLSDAGERLIRALPEAGEYRSQAVDDLDELENVSAAGAPCSVARAISSEANWRANAIFHLCAPRLDRKDQRLVDPAVLSTDTICRSASRDVSRDGKLLAYSVQHGGADERSVRFLNVATGKALEDELPSAR